MATQKNRLHEVTDPSGIKIRAFDETSYANFQNTCNVTVYIRIVWPYGGITNFVLRAGETHSLYIGTGGNPCGCYSTLGTPDCGDLCGEIQGGYTYVTC
ncbi:hypothetical protein F2P45_16940 [Massilia sp. CCM 8733]|uniref:Uncharacterized protein n=1 Tax=Massilia mucilaginosa TaxID=2609282 RepID=A0ABX0NVD8_9BURK|nr:hypothetical protein [Massilia mucilaginosa]NHZ90694.1 hypothetical protein [Massilia mucilaginosa]